MNGDANVAIALLLTLIAGLSTGIGSTIAFFIKKPNVKYLCFTLGLSAGVMLYISFVELLPEAFSVVGELWGIYAFFAGIIIIGIIDVLIPEIENPHHYDDFGDEKPETDQKLMRVGLFTALAIAIHNFPEGIATFGSALVDVKLGILITFAIALHNIPEGISVSIPIFYATKDKKKAFMYSFLSGFSEPLGAVIGFLILLPFISDWTLSFLLAFIAGIMVYISADELLPTAHRYGHGHCVILGLILGMFIMAVSLLLL
ncbi:MAG: zinc transporter ZupT [Thermoplasmatota archaeon]